MRKVSPKKLCSLLRVPELSEKKLPNCYYVLCLQEFLIAFYIQTIMYYAYRNFYLLFTSKSEHLQRCIAYSFDRFCSLNHTKVRKVGISEIWIRGRSTCFVNSLSNWERVGVLEMSLNPFRHGLSDQRLGMGGPKKPPQIYGYRRIFSLILLYIYLYLDVKAQNPEAYPPT